MTSAICFSSRNQIPTWADIARIRASIVFLDGCLFLSALFARLDVLPDFLRTFLVEGFIIVGWVSLWHPVEILLYEWWPHRRDALHYEPIRDHMTISIVAEP